MTKLQKRTSGILVHQATRQDLEEGWLEAGTEYKKRGKVERDALGTRWQKILVEGSLWKILER